MAPMPTMASGDPRRPGHPYERAFRGEPEARELEIDRHELPNLRALNFVLKGFLGEGVMSNTKMDPQAKSLGEYLRAKIVDVPEELL